VNKGEAPQRVDVAEELFDQKPNFASVGQMRCSQPDETTLVKEDTTIDSYIK
jgi:hypothetical protein